MSGLLHKIVLITTGLAALWFSFIFVNQPFVPYYHNIFLFMVSWVLFYYFFDIAFHPTPIAEKTELEKKRKKVRRKNQATPEKS